MRVLLPPLIFLVLMLVGCSQSSHDPLTFQAPNGWKIEHQTPGGLHLYSVKAGPPGGGLLNFSPWLSQATPEELPALVRQLAETFLNEAQQSSKFTLASHKYQVEHFSGERCQGSYVVLQIGSSSTNLLQTMFMMSVDGSIWHGQFTGPSSEWSEAITVLKSIREVD